MFRALVIGAVVVAADGTSSPDDFRDVEREMVAAQKFGRKVSISLSCTVQ